VFEGADVAAVRAQMRGEGSSGEGTTPPNVGEERAQSRELLRESRERTERV
jgi:hypothetical protein